VSVDSLFDIDSDETVDRVLNVCKIWIDRYFEDFQQDRTLLTKLVEFVDKSMLPNEKMARAGENMKAQIANKLSTKEEKKNYMFDQQPPGISSLLFIFTYPVIHLLPFQFLSQPLLTLKLKNV
jgi:hypothetical protein